MTLRFTNTLFFLGLTALTFVPLAVVASPALRCIESIKAEFALYGNGHHPEKFYFSRTEKNNEFLLINKNNSYLCTTTNAIRHDSLIDVMTRIPELADARHFYYLNKPQRGTPAQSKHDAVPRNGTALISHTAIESVTQVTNASTLENNYANCAANSNGALAEKHLLKIASVEIEDLVADLSENRDQMYYGWGLKPENIKTQKIEFDRTLKKALEVCAEAPELKPVVLNTYKKMKPYLILHPNLTSLENTSISIKAPRNGAAQ